MTNRLLMVARVAGAFGVKGEIRISTFTEDPLVLGHYRDLLAENGTPALTVTVVRPAKGGVVARAKEVATREQAEALRGLRLFIPRDRLPPVEDNEFYLADLIGLAAETAEGAPLGVVKAVNDFGAGDLLEIQPPHGPGWWLPFTRAAVPHVLLTEGKLIVVKPDEIE